MKKLLLGLLLLCSTRAFSAITDEGVTREKTVAIHFSSTVATGVNPTSFILISLSTTTGLFPHTDRGEIDISHIGIQLDKLAASTATVKIGVFTMVSPSTSSVTFFFTQSSAKNASNTGPEIFANLTQSFYRCKVKPNPTSTNTLVDGLTPFILSNDFRSGTGIYTSTGTIPTPTGTSIVPRVGDIMMEIFNSDITNTINVLVDLLYHSEP